MIQQWEYLEAYVYQDEWVDTSGRREKLSHKFKVRDAVVYFTSATLLEELGGQGWELISVAYVDMTLYRLFLKRARFANSQAETEEFPFLPALAV